MVKHSYILELKYLPQSATKEKAEAQWAEAIEQIKAYTQGIHARRKGTTAHEKNNPTSHCGAD